MSGDLMAFLRARFDEEAGEARDAARKAASGRDAELGSRAGDWRFERGDDSVTAVQTHPERPGEEMQLALVTEAQSYVGDHIDDEIGIFIARHDPARILADIDAKRGLLGRYAEVADMDYEDNEPEYAYGRATGLGEAVRLLALPYASHPDYREEWRP